MSTISASPIDLENYAKAGIQPCIRAVPAGAKYTQNTRENTLKSEVRTTEIAASSENDFEAVFEKGIK